MTDVLVRDGGSIWICQALTIAAREWFTANVSTEGFQPDFPERVIVETRYLADIVLGLSRSGLEVASA